MLSRLSVPVVLLLVVGVLLAGGSLAGSSAGTTRPAVAGAAGIGDPYFPEDGNGGIDVRSYDVHDRYRFSDGRLTGWTTVRLHTTERLRSFDLGRGPVIRFLLVEKPHARWRLVVVAHHIVIDGWSLRTTSR